MIDWADIARRFELTGAGIVNGTQFCAVEALADGSRHVRLDALETATPEPPVLPPRPPVRDDHVRPPMGSQHVVPDVVPG